MHKEPMITLEKTRISAQSSILAGFFEGQLALGGDLKNCDQMSGNAISQAIKGDFKAEKGDIKLLSPAGKLHAVVLVGLGKKDTIQQDQVMDAVADAVKSARAFGIKELHILTDSFEVKGAVRCITIGSLLGAHRFMRFKTKNLDKVKNLERIVVMVESPSAHEREFSEALISADAVKKTRDMVNTPPNIATTDEVSDYARKVGTQNKLTCTVLDELALEKLGMGCMLAVGKGSNSRPKIVVMEYWGAGSKKPLLLVGKGITFDSGGYNLKPTNSISNMKDDKAGALTVLHTIEAAAKLKLKVNLVAVLALAENMVSGIAYRPDDIITAHNGMTIEITNTDAEGRLVLADALSYSVEKFKPEAVVDIATLTGASMIALGTVATPIVGNDDALIEKVISAGIAIGEKMWQLPLWDEYAEGIKSDIADIKNATDGPDAGVIVGAMFLKNFVGEVKWAHLDIGTTVWSKADKGMKQKGATGVCVRTLIEFVKQWE